MIDQSLPESYHPEHLGPFTDARGVLGVADTASIICYMYDA